MSERVLVHADGGACHGTPLVNGRCPKCRTMPDMQSIELWPVEKKVAADAPIPNAEEEAIFDHITKAVQGIQNLGLKVNREELAAAAHVMGSFVIRHMLQRMAPHYWSDWYAIDYSKTRGEPDSCEK